MANILGLKGYKSDATGGSEYFNSIDKKRYAEMKVLTASCDVFR